MRRFLFTLVFFPTCVWGQFFCGPENCDYSYYISACAMFQQEGRFLKEWIEYHKLLGVQHFYLYNNRSTDDYLSVLAPYIESGEVELFWWPSQSDEDWTLYQKLATQDAVERAKKSSYWLAILDVDEFIVPTHHDSLTEFLTENEPRCSQVFMMRRFFGTNYVEKIPEDKLMIETLTKRTSFVSGEMRLHKEIVKPRLVQHVSINECALRPEASVLDLGQAQEEYPHLVLHRYWTRDIEFLKTDKNKKQERYHSRLMSEEEIERIMNVYNHVEDDTILRFVGPLRRIIFKEE